MAYIRLGDGVKKGFEQDMVSALTTLGYYAMMHAYGLAIKSWTHRTRNLHDSYASAVYVNGKLIESSVRYVGGVLSRKVDAYTGRSGRETVNDYLRSHHFGEANGEIVLVVIAAMFYAGILEKGGKGSASRGPGDRFIVVSPARQYIDQHYWTTVYKVYDKYGLTEKPKARILRGERLK